MKTPILSPCSPSTAARTSAKPVGLLAAAVFGLGLVATPALAEQPNLVQCRAYDADFDYTGVLTECGVAAGDPRTSPTERIEVFRLLGFAHTALGSPDKAQIWYLRLLAIDPSHRFGKEVSPRFRDGFKRARRKFKKAGRVRASHAPIVIDDKTDINTPLPMKVTLSDPLARVSAVVARIEPPTDAADEGKAPDAKAPVEILLEKESVDGAAVTFVGAFPPAKTLLPKSAERAATIRYTLALQSALGAVISPSPSLAPVEVTVTKETLAALAKTSAQSEAAVANPPPPPPAEDESEGLGTGALIGLGVGGAAAAGLLMTAAVGGSITFFCLQNERCTAPAPRSRPAASARVNVN